MNDLRLLLKNISKISPVSDEIVERMKKNSTIIFWGAGSTGQEAFDYLSTKGVRPNYFTDKQEKLHGKFIEDIEIIPSEKIKKFVDPFILVTSNSYFPEISLKLKEMGVKETNFACANIAPKHIREGAREHLEKNITKYEEAYRLLADELSRNTYYSTLKYRLTLDNTILEPIFKSNQYFGHNFNVKPCRNYVDCGAFDGDTVKKFILTVGGCYDNIYCFEPDLDNYSKLIEYIEKKHLKNVHTFRIGVWNKKDILKFKSIGPAAGLISPDGDLSIEVNSLDNILESKKIDCIKMDIEGAELEALYGAINTIKNNRPLLLISAYHNLQDFYEIPIFINSLNLEYEFYFRHHSMSSGETVCYAVPK